MIKEKILNILVLAIANNKSDRKFMSYKGENIIMEENNFIAKGKLFDLLYFINYDKNDEFRVYDNFRTVMKTYSHSIGIFYKLFDKCYMEVSFKQNAYLKISDDKINQAINDYAMGGLDNLNINEKELISKIMKLQSEIVNINYKDENLFKSFYYDGNLTIYSLLSNEYQINYENIKNKIYPEWYKQYLLEKTI